jgi:hypothetical protein
MAEKTNNKLLQYALRYWYYPYFSLKQYCKFRNKHDYIDSYFQERDNLLQFKNIHTGKDCYIIGNGPSLNKIDLTLLNNYYTFGLNKIFLINKRCNFLPTYLIAVNKLVIEQSKEEFNRLHLPIFLAKVHADGIIDDRDNIFKFDTNVPWKFHKDLILGVSEGYTVTFTALQIAYFMGFKRVFLIGVDHNYRQKGKPNQKQKMSEEDINHFDPNYFKGHEWKLADIKSSEKSYRFAKKNFEKDSRIIYDATIGGKLNIFQKIDFQESLTLCRKKRS